MGNLCAKYPRRKYSSRNHYPSSSINFSVIKSYQPPPQPYIIHSNPPSPYREMRQDEGQSGLQNKGNTCFANAALQCILNTPFLISYFTTDSKNLSNISQFTRAISKLFKSKWKVTQENADPSEILELVWNNNQLFKPGDQNDAHEFLLYLLDQLHEELKKPCPNQNCSSIDKGEKSWENYLKNNYSIISKEFQGQTKKTLICNKCGYVKKKYEPFMYLSLSIPNNKSATIKDCLTHFCEQEFLAENEKWFCPKCDILVEAIKQNDIIRLPRYLIIHLKRFKDIHRKIKDLVRYEEELDMKKFVQKNNEGDNRYRMYAKIKHMGSINGGHYVASARQDEYWYCFNDSHVRQEPFSTSHDTYLLFYEKIDQTVIIKKSEDPIKDIYHENDLVVDKEKNDQLIIVKKSEDLVKEVNHDNEMIIDEGNNDVGKINHLGQIVETNQMTFKEDISDSDNIEDDEIESKIIIAQEDNSDLERNIYDEQINYSKQMMTEDNMGFTRKSAYAENGIS